MVFVFRIFVNWIIEILSLVSPGRVAIQVMVKLIPTLTVWVVVVIWCASVVIFIVCIAVMIVPRCSGFGIGALVCVGKWE